MAVRTHRKQVRGNLLIKKNLYCIGRTGKITNSAGSHINEASFSRKTNRILKQPFLSSSSIYKYVIN